MMAALELSALEVLTDDWGRFLLALTIKTSLVLIVVALACTLLRRVSASTRHVIWTIGIVGVLLMPVIVLVLPSWPVQGVADPWPGTASREHRETTLRWLAQRPQAGPETPSAEAGRREEALSPGEWEMGVAAEPEDRATEPVVSPWLPTEGAAAKGPWSRVTIIAFFVWVGGTCLILATFLVGMVRLRWLVRLATEVRDPDWVGPARELAERIGFRGSVRILRSDRLVTPMSWGLWRGVILLPSNCDDWNDETRQDVLVHEISHLKRRDCLTQSLANIACVLHWFNPLVWFAGSKMRTERERACDDQVLIAGSKASSYADNLLEIAVSLAPESRSSYVSVAMARRSQISGRLMAVLDAKTHRRTPGRGLILATVVLMTCLLLPIGALSPGGSGISAEVLTSDRDRADLRDAIPDGVVQGVSDKVLAGIQDSNRRFEELLERKDIEGMAQIYTRDAQQFTFLRPPMVGRDEVTGGLQHLLDQGVGRMKIHMDEIFPIGEMVCDIGRFVALSEDGVVLARGKYITIWKMEDGRWKVYRDISTI
jgi:beta-lactamase regulating signal transducer with metallopeptidase domain/ketosteroid isomerase-like protein